MFSGLVFLPLTVASSFSPKSTKMSALNKLNHGFAAFDNLAQQLVMAIGKFLFSIKLFCVHLCLPFPPISRNTDPHVPPSVISD